MFKNLIRKLYNWSRRDSFDSSNQVMSVHNGNPIKSKSGNPHHSLETTENGFHFVIYNANGGKIIQCWHYDKVTDRQKSNVYIIHSEDDLATELSMIMTRESLSR
jgi:hypothetical protein